MNRRGFLQTCLAVAVAPALIKVENLMRPRVAWARLSSGLLVALYRGDPQAGGLEVDGASYERGEFIGNGSPVIFPAPTGAWGEVTHAVLCGPQGLVLSMPLLVRKNVFCGDTVLANINVQGPLFL